MGVKGQCKNEAGWKTPHPGTGNCMYHDRAKTEAEVIGIGSQVENLPASVQKRSPIYDKGLVEGDPKALYGELSGMTTAESLKLNEELALARATLLRLQNDMQAGRFEDPKDFYAESSRLLDTISKLVERSQPKSTLTINNVQNVLMKVIEVVHQEVNDPLIIERIIQKLATIPVVKQ
jgi:hypothetical protein